MDTGAASAAGISSDHAITTPAAELPVNS